MKVSKTGDNSIFAHGTSLGLGLIAYCVHQLCYVTALHLVESAATYGNAPRVIRLHAKLSV